MEWLRYGLILTFMVAPVVAKAQTPPASPTQECSVGGGTCTAPTGTQPNTTPESTMEGGSAGSATPQGNSTGTLDNTSPDSSVDPGDSSTSGGSSNGGSSNNGAGSLGNSTSD
jgi:hypothetical protein